MQRLYVYLTSLARMRQCETETNPIEITQDWLGRTPVEEYGVIWATRCPEDIVMLNEILNNTDIERVKELATPRPDIKMDNAASAKARALASQGLTQAEISRVLGVSLTTLKKGLADG